MKFHHNHIYEINFWDHVESDDIRQDLLLCKVIGKCVGVDRKQVKIAAWITDLDNFDKDDDHKVFCIAKSTIKEAFRLHVKNKVF